MAKAIQPAFEKSIPVAFVAHFMQGVDFLPHHDQGLAMLAFVIVFPGVTVNDLHDPVTLEDDAGFFTIEAADCHRIFNPHCLFFDPPCSNKIVTKSLSIHINLFPNSKTYNIPFF
jgi:hypothetical protein